MTGATPAAAVLTGYRCPGCRAGLVSDHLREELVCPKCGIVASEQHGTYEHERSRRPRGAGEKPQNARASGKTTMLRHDMGITTAIAPTGSDYSGKKLPQAAAEQARTMRKWQKRMRATTPEDRRLAEMLGTINNMCEAASLTDSVRETAAMTYRMVAKKSDVKGKSTVGMAAASIYAACKRHGIVKGLAELCAGACASDDEAARKAKTALRCYRDMVIEVDGMQKSQSQATPIPRYISKMANMSRVDTRIERLALGLAEKAPGGAALGGKTPQGVAAAYLYIAAALLGQPTAQREVSAVAGVGDVTIRSRCRDLLAQHRIRIALRPAGPGAGAQGAAAGEPARRVGGRRRRCRVAARDEAVAAVRFLGCQARRELRGAC